MISNFLLQKSTRCFDHSQLAVKSKEEKSLNEEPIKMEQFVKSVTRDNVKSVSDSCCKSCGTKKRISISSQIKTTHNKSEIGLKEKKCTLHRKSKNNKNANVIPSIGAPLAEHILMKTY